jgi:hypothetical protein
MKIKVPKTPKQAFRKDRQPSDLLKDQVRHLEWAARPAAKRSPAQIRRIGPPKTEGEAAERIAALTRKILAANTPANAATEPGPAEGATTPLARDRPARPSRKTRKSTRDKNR